MRALQQKQSLTRATKGQLVGQVDGRLVFFDKSDADSPAFVEAFVNSVTGGDPYDWCLRQGFLKETAKPDWMERLINEVHVKWAAGNKKISEK